MRLVSFILLLALLPSMASAIPGSAVLCIGSDHVSFDCHASEPCGSEDAPDSGASPRSDRSCFDVESISIASRPVRSADSNALFQLLFTPGPAIAETIPAVFPVVCFGGDDPPSFCAKAFCATIAMRC